MCRSLMVAQPITTATILSMWSSPGSPPYPYLSTSSMVEPDQILETGSRPFSTTLMITIPLADMETRTLSPLPNRTRAHAAKRLRRSVASMVAIGVSLPSCRDRALWAGFSIFYQFCNVHNLPKAISHTSGHRRYDAKRFMDADEVVIHHVQRDRVGVVFDFLGECVGSGG